MTLQQHKNEYIVMSRMHPLISVIITLRYGLRHESLSPMKPAFGGGVVERQNRFSLTEPEPVRIKIEFIRLTILGRISLVVSPA